MDNIHSANGNVEKGDKHITAATSEGEGQNLNSGSLRLSPPSVIIETSKEMMAKAEPINDVPPSVQPGPPPAPDRPEDQNNNNQRGPSPAPSPPAPTQLPKVGVD